MKNKLILFTAFTGLLLFSSFQTVNNDDAPTLSGTEWVLSGEGTAGENEEIPFTFTQTLSFTSDNAVLSSYEDSLGEKSDPKVGTYVYSHPTITLTFKGEEEGDEDEIFSGTIDGNTMTFSVGKFIKQ